MRPGRYDPSASLCGVDERPARGDTRKQASQPGGRLRRLMRLVLLSGLVSGLVSSVGLVVAGPASAAVLGDAVGNAYNPEALSLPVALALFIGVPVLGFLISALLSFRTKRDKGRYRPGQPWDHDTEWFGRPPERSDERRRMALPHAGGASGRW